MQPQQTTDVEGSPDAGAVLRFLTANPDFFNHHQDVLPRLHIPHASGRAVSLVERQLSALRGRCASLEDSLRDLIGVARANEELQGRLHALVREIVSAASLDTIVAATRRNLRESFGAESVHVLLVDADGCEGGAGPALPEGAHRVRVAADDARLGALGELFEAGGTRCGMPDGAQLELIVEAAEARAGIGSAALIPLAHEGPLGVVMLSSRDESRFGAGKGVVFLDQLGEVLSRRVHALTRAADASRPALEHELEHESEHGPS